MKVLLSTLGSTLASRGSERDAAAGWLAAPQRWTDARMDIAEAYPDWVQQCGTRCAKVMRFLVLTAAAAGSAWELGVRAREFFGDLMLEIRFARAIRNINRENTPAKPSVAIRVPQDSTPQFSLAPSVHRRSRPGLSSPTGRVA